MREYAALITNRENLYRLLGRLYQAEVDKSLLGRMVELGFPAECEEPELSGGYRMLTAYLQNSGPDPLTDLAVDYAAVFLGAGIAEGIVAYPYESVYTSPERLVMQDAWEQVVSLYQAKGLNKAGALDIPEDHIALECEFMATLCRDSGQAVAAQDLPGVSASLREQQRFLAQHLLNWVPAFCADIQKCAQTDFYKAIAGITTGYLRLEQILIEDLIHAVGDYRL
ncbi:TorD/DmsD family molecular chaperone [Brenneria tiliae]|uniref:Molecular chaperone TorD family protein n=1 Tax=Brenneria tiliae TaxID=2914984 RepID=A0ABT0MSP1_9GAMM|nr:molecular chaperone TorD family protein [Brenneria tiliae]MCL2892866.1 molecular chaperone TorD family protein [Brenneria tiliae]